MVEKPHNSRCLNPSCEGKSDNCLPAPDFSLSYYRVKRSKSYKEEICEDCYLKSVADFDKLGTSLKLGEEILKVNNLPINNLCF